MSAEVLAGVPAEVGVAKPDAVLTLQGVTRAFGGLLAVDVDRLEIARRSITSLIGPNGAGKTTLFNLVTGFDRPDRGEIRLDGRPLVRRAGPLRRGAAAHTVARRGMVRTFQLTKVLSRLSVIDNMRLAAPGQRGEAMLAGLLQTWRAQERAVTRRADELLERFGLSQVRDEMAGTLSGGQRKLLEMARALMVEPKVVLFDEPMAGVNPALAQSLLAHLVALRDEGRTVVLIEHDMDVVMEISDWVVCMAEGRVIAEGRPREVAGDAAVIDAYLGTRRGGR